VSTADPISCDGRHADELGGNPPRHDQSANRQTPDGHSRLELMKLQRPTAVSAEPKNARYVRGPEGIIVALAEQLS
jgi:hypothetical protein